jgi:SAM-dependent methyltransferase
VADADDRRAASDTVIARLEAEHAAARARAAAAPALPDARPTPQVQDGDLAHLSQTWDVFLPSPTDSPFKAGLRRLLAPAVRFTFRQQRVFNSAVVAHLNRRALSDDWLKRWESLGAREARYTARHDALAASYAELKDMVAITQQTALSLKREVERLVGSAGSSGSAGSAHPAPRTEHPAPGSAHRAPGTSQQIVVSRALDSFKYVGFEDRFRGSQDVIRARLASYLPLFEGAGPVVELGCGRGEFLDLLRERGIAARGVDVNHEMVEVSRSRGLDATEGDALSFLTAQPDDSLGGVFAAQVAEHLEPEYLMRVIDAAMHALRGGGVLVLETINPACWTAFFESYLRDLTHVRPLHPDTLQYLVRSSGFHDVSVEFRSPIADADRLQTVPLPPGEIPPTLADLLDTFNANVNRLNARLFTYQDYAVIGRK